MALAERTSDFEFLTNDEGLLGAYYLQFPDTAALASFQGNEVGDTSEVVLQLLLTS